MCSSHISSQECTNTTTSQEIINNAQTGHSLNEWPTVSHPSGLHSKALDGFSSDGQPMKGVDDLARTTSVEATPAIQLTFCQI